MYVCMCERFSVCICEGEEEEREREREKERKRESVRVCVINEDSHAPRLTIATQHPPISTLK